MLARLLEQVGVELGRMPLVAPQPDREHTVVPMSDRRGERQAGQLHREAPNEIDVRAADDPRVPLAVGEPLEHREHWAVPIGQPRRVLGEREGDLRIADPIRRPVPAELVGDAAEVVGLTQALQAGDPLIDEVPEVAERVPALPQTVGQRDAVPGGELDHGGRSHRALEMDVEVHLRQRPQVSDHG
jgi:hypothetical protein